jgi:hypothetical protein
VVTVIPSGRSTADPDGYQVNLPDRARYACVPQLCGGAGHVIAGQAAEIGDRTQSGCVSRRVCSRWSEPRGWDTLNLLPRKGKAWRPVGRPARLRATYTRTHGVRHMLAALDLATGRMVYRIRDRKRWGEFLDLLKVLRRTYPGNGST